MIEWLAGLGPVQEAGMVARLFHQDPVALLDDGGDEWPMLVRVAAARYVARVEEREAKRAQEQAKD